MNRTLTMMNGGRPRRLGLLQGPGVTISGNSKAQPSKPSTHRTQVVSPASDGSRVGASASEPTSVGDTSLRELRFVHPQAILLTQRSQPLHSCPASPFPLSQNAC